ncbi:hydrogenase nickel incorporation protein HypB [bacterium]|nr:hydrogenase nickel incorporation protein HypB [bacterium]
MNEIRHIAVKESLLKSNDYLARELRERWTRSGTLVVNLLSSPGSGKTTLLEATLPRLMERYRVLVLEGDLETERDADRVRGIGADALQITTGGGCHLEAHMIQQAWDALGVTEPYDLVFIENVGNLVCPSSFDLGEHVRVVLLSVPEGDDKPPKYPKAFRTSQAMMLTKMDVAEHFDFRPDEAERLAREIQPDLAVFRTSARTGEGLDDWYAWLEARREEVLAPA